MKRKASIISILALVLVVSACSGNSGGDNKVEPTAGTNTTNKVDDNAAEKPVGPLNMSMALMSSPKTPNSWAEKALEGELTAKLDREVNVDPVFLPDWSELNTKINLLMSAKDTRPNILWTGDTKEYLKWVDAGVIQDVTPSLQKYGKEIINYYSKDTLFYHWDPSGKMFRIPADVPEASYMTTIIRKDWLDKLGLQVPKTLDEYVEVLRAFTKDDPDQNGKDDTYGLSGDNYYRSLIPFFYAYGVDVENFIRQEDGSIKFGSVMPEVKKVLELLQTLYKEGVIDPRMATAANSNDQMVNDIFSSGKAGSFYRFVDYFNPGNTATVSFKKLNPEGEYISIDPVVGPGGFGSDQPDPGIGWCYLVITDTTNADDAVQVLNTMATPETFKLISFGKEGEHYEMKDSLFTPTITPDEGSKLGLGNFGWYIQRKDAANIKNTAEVTEMFESKKATSQPMRDKIVVFKALDRPEWDKYSADIKKERDETFWAIITGKKQVSAFDEFVAKYEKLGGKQIDEETAGLLSKQDEEHKQYEAWYSENIEPFK